MIEVVPTTEQVSAILPVYNEQACIESTFDVVLEFAQWHPNYQFLFVDDGSIDWTKPFLKMKLNASHTKQIQLLSYNCNRGKGYAVRLGMTHVNGDYICYLDGDLAYSLEHLESLVAELRHADVVIGCRNLAVESVKASKRRKTAGKVFNWLSRVLLGLPYDDMQPGIKGFTRSSATLLFSKQRLSSFSFDVELIYVSEKIWILNQRDSCPCRRLSSA